MFDDTIIALGILYLSFLFRPRKWPIYAFQNFISLIGFMILIGGALSFFATPSMIYMFLVLFLLILLIIYLGYWSIPSHQYWRKNRKVRDVIRHYKHRHESMGPPALHAGWLPRLTVEDKSYFLQLYYLSYDISGILGVDYEGNIVRDLKLIKKLYRTREFAYEMSLPSAHSRRSSAYKGRRETFLRQLAFIKNYEQLSAPLLENHDKDRKQVYEAALVVKRVMETNQKNDLLEATWAAEHKHVHLKEASYEETLSMANQIRENTIWIMDEIQIMLDGATSAKRLLKQIEAGELEVSKDYSLLLNTVLEGRETAKGFREMGEINDETMPIYQRISGDEIEVWEGRFIYMERVDRGEA